MKVTPSGGVSMTKEHREMIRVLFSQQYISYLNEWEETFLTSITRESFLTEKQLAALNKVFDLVTSGERDNEDCYP